MLVVKSGLVQRATAGNAEAAESRRSYGPSVFIMIFRVDEENLLTLSNVINAGYPSLGRVGKDKQWKWRTGESVAEIVARA